MYNSTAAFRSYRKQMGILVLHVAIDIRAVEDAAAPAVLPAASNAGPK
jgi:hypothetical protein